jgi:hypothetical protein
MATSYPRRSLSSWFVCLQTLRAYADACESGAIFCHLSQRDTTLESE